MKKFDHFKSNLKILEKADKEDLTNEFILGGIIDKFFIQFELGWKVLKELLTYEGDVYKRQALCLKEVEADCQNTEKRQESILEKLKNVVLESGKFLLNNGKARTIMIVNSLIGAVSTLVLFFLQAKLPMAGLNSLALGPALCIMGLGAVAGARMVAYFPQYSYKKLLILSAFGVGCAPVSYTHLDVYKRQHKISTCMEPLT